jgi:hypothetical protein
MRPFGTTGNRFRSLIAATLVAGMFAGPAAGVSAQDEETFEYDQDGVVFSVTYDPEVWEPGTEAGSSALTLNSVDGSIATFLSDPELGDELAGCLANVVEPFEEGAGVTDGADADDPGAGEGDGYVYQTRSLTLSDIDTTVLHVCFDIGDGNLLWVAGVVLDGAPLDDVYTLLEGVEGDSISYDLDFAAGTSGGDDDGTPAAGDGTPAAGGDGEFTTYESPTYGYTVEFDESVYGVTGEGEGTGPEGTRDLLQLEDEAGEQFLYVEGSDEWADTDACVASLYDEVTGILEDSLDVALSDATIAVDPETGDDFEISEADRSAVAYETEINGLATTILVDCYASPDGDVIVGFTSGAATDADYFEDIYPDVQTVIESLEFAS